MVERVALPLGVKVMQDSHAMAAFQLMNQPDFNKAHDLNTTYHAEQDSEYEWSLRDLLKKSWS